jgi:light-regulated signal transduction histidine kinase (bacteriophytochrome)
MNVIPLSLFILMTGANRRAVGFAKRMRESHQVFGLMSYSRIGRSTTLTTVDCTRIINDTLADLDSAIKASKADIQLGKMPGIEAYESELRRLFRNLTSNAIKFHQKDPSPQVNIS